jgi:hypothetical protein
MIVQFGGQTPLNLALPLKQGGRADHRHVAGVDRSGGRPQAVRQAAGGVEDSAACRARWRPAWKRRWRARSASAIRCWCGLRYVLGGRAMVIAYDASEVRAT